MFGRSTRRRALGLGLALLGGLTVSLPLSEPAAAQPDLPADVPYPSEDDATVPAELPAPDPPPPVAMEDPWGVAPATLAIPKLGVQAEVAPVNYDEEGLMAIPPDPDMVAWFEYGPGMGVGGNAIFAAHVDWGGRPRVFARLTALEPGDAVLIMDVRGRGFQYVVESSHVYDAEGAPVEEIFAQTVEPMITLITCGGRYQAATREYLDRIVVVAKGA